jgi:hypothetical protein
MMYYHHRGNMKKTAYNLSTREERNTTMRRILFVFYVSLGFLSIKIVTIVAIIAGINKKKTAAPSSIIISFDLKHY